MEDNKDIKEKKVEKQVKIQVIQACNELKINGYFRIFREKKYKGQEHTLKEWENLFKGDRKSKKDNKKK